MSTAQTHAALSRFDLAGRVIVVTGALGLLGRQHCTALAQAGASVVVADREASACEAFAAQLAEAHGCSSMGQAVDIADRAAVEQLHQVITSRLGPVDVLVNNAAINDAVEATVGGAAEPATFERYPLALWQQVLEVNVTGTFLCCQVFGAAMAQRRAGSIINIASTYALVAPDQRLYRRADGTQPFIKSAAYPVSKAAVLALTRYLAAYWGSAGVRVNAISPGGVENGQEEQFIAAYAQRTPLERMARPDELGGALIFLASDASSYVTGANLVVDGGWTVW